MYKAVIFDLDGTLVDSKYGIMQSVSYALTKMGISFKDEELMRFVGPSHWATLSKYYPYLKKQEQDLFVKYFRADYDDGAIFKTVLFEDTIPFLEKLKENSKIIDIATVKPYKAAMTVLNSLDITEYFNIVSGSIADGVNTFTKKDVINNCIKNHLDIDKKDICMIGDTRGDALGAEEVGIDFFAVLRDFNEDEFSGHKVKKYVKTFNELLPVILDK